MIKYVISLLLLIQAGCRSDERAKFLPIDKRELKFKKGECLAFKADSFNYGVAIVIDFSKDEGGLWYGLLFTNYLEKSIPKTDSIINQKLFGRKIRSTYDKKGYFVGLNLEFVKDSCFIENADKYISIGFLSLDSTKIAYGSQGASGDYDEMIEAFRWGLDLRIEPPEDYRDYKSSRTDEYFELRDYINN